MFVIDDFILATLIVIGVVLLGTLLVIIATPFLCLIGLVGVAYSRNKIIGGNKHSEKANIKKAVETLDKLEKSVTTLRETKLKSFNKIDKKIDPIEEFKKKYTSVKVDADELTRQKKYIEIVKNIYIKENQSRYLELFDIDIKKWLAYYNGSQISSKKSDVKIMSLIKYRTLTDDYPTTSNTAITGHNVKDITYTPTTKQYTQTLDKLFEYAIMESIRNLTPSEQKESSALAQEFNTGKLTHVKKTVTFYDNSSKTITDCKSASLGASYSDKYKQLHWGQRKLLLSEIDFFNRVADDMKVDNFKNQEISLVYPGSAHGHHLLFEMELYPNITMYLWDPARYNPVLYLADFMRRGLPLDFPYKPEHKELAKKYVGRVFINMELSDKDFIKYHDNAANGNIPKNYETQWGFFTKKSADYYLAYIKKQKKQSLKTLFISDIRLFTNATASNTLIYSRIKGYSNLLGLNIAHEKNKFIDYTRDMRLQRDWMGFCKADYGLFKFKLRTPSFSISDLQSEYYNGDIVLQVWAPVSSTETRLYVAPHHLAKNNGVAYYNVKKYTDKIRTFNIDMRLADLSNIKLTDIGIEIDITLGAIWDRFIPKTSVIGMDAVLETNILYDYLCMNKQKNRITAHDIILLISDTTQTLLNKFDFRCILGYKRNLSPDRAEKLLSYRNHYHKKFINRMDYQSASSDADIC